MDQHYCLARTIFCLHFEAENSPDYETIDHRSISSGVSFRFHCCLTDTIFRLRLNEENVTVIVPVCKRSAVKKCFCCTSHLDNPNITFIVASLIVSVSEPAMLLMHNSIKTHPIITYGLLEFICKVNRLV